MLKRGISLAEAARRLGMTQSDFYMALQKGQIPTLRRHGRTVIPTGALKEYQIRSIPTSDYRL
jgi:DNA-binding transcriptional LysR family regulator